MRHANPWSVYTRFTTLPALILASWSRIWLGWWSLAPVALAVAWTWLNPRVFPRPHSTDNWASRGVFGERLWLNRKNVPVPEHHRVLPNVLSFVMAIGLPLLLWGIWALSIWPAVVGLVLVTVGKMWFVDRMGWIYEDMKDQDPEYAGWLYRDKG